MYTSPIKTAFILGAGMGTRLRPLTDNCPKPLLPVGGRPIITHAMNHLMSVGIERFIINTHHCADVYRQIFPDKQWRGIPIIFRHELVLLDTAGGMKNIEDLLHNDETILVYNGDTITDLPLQRLIDAHFLKQKEITLALRSSGLPLNVNLNARGEICDLRHILGDPGIRSCLFTGIYVIEKRFLNRLKVGLKESVIPIFVEMIREQLGSVAGVLIDEGRWCEIGSVADYEKINTLLSDKNLDQMTHLQHEMLQFVCGALGLEKTTSIHTMPVATGGSVRSFHRIRYGDDSSVIFMHYDRCLEENNYYTAIAEFLREIDIPVPRIMAHDHARGFIVMEDIGDADLCSFRNEPWPVKYAIYRKALTIAQRLHSFPVEEFPSEKVPLMEGFGPALYRWERSYFFENFVQAVCGIELSSSDRDNLENELKDLSNRLEDTKPSLVHRDFQSQNVMICKGELILIDFQGMRFGNSLYDLGSLLYDPYVSMTDDERMELLHNYYELRPLGEWKDFQENFREVSAQRLMQALGAYGYLGLKRGLSEFLTYIPAGIANLIDATTRTIRLPLLKNLALRCQQVL